MAQLKDLIVNGVARIVGKVYAPEFVGKLTGNADTATKVNGHTVNSDVPADAKFTDTEYTHPNSGATAGTYHKVTVNAQGHVTGGSNPTVTVAEGGTGATDAATARSNLGITPANIGAAAASHGTHVSFSTTAPKANGTAAVGTETTVSRSDHVHPAQTSVTGSSGSCTGNAATATALTSSAGSATQPVYFSGGKPVKTTYTLEKSVPSNAVFTDTTYSNMTAATASAAGKAGLVPAPAAGKQTSFLRGDGTWVVPTNTTYSNFVKSGSGAKAGLVPAPSTTAGTTKYLREDGTWAVPPDTNTTYTLSSFGVTATAAELNYCDGVTSNIQTQLDNKLSLSGGTVTGTFAVSHSGSTTEGGQVDLLAPPSGDTYNGIILDTAKGSFRIFGIASKDGTSKTGVGAVLAIDPYAKTISGDYSLAGNLKTNTEVQTAYGTVTVSALNTVYTQTLGFKPKIIIFDDASGANKPITANGSITLQTTETTVMNGGLTATVAFADTGFTFKGTSGNTASLKYIAIG